jgi:hypothetical protein
MSAIVINFFGGPCSGKSTLAAGLFYFLKRNMENCELVTEYAKDLTYSERHRTLKCQPYVFGKQLYRIEILLDKVDIIINDSPLYLSLFYNQNTYPESFNSCVMDISNKMNNINYYIDRGKDKNYNLYGRKESFEEAKALDANIKNFLETFRIPHKTISKKFSATAEIMEDIKMYRLNSQDQKDYIDNRAS